MTADVTSLDDAPETGLRHDWNTEEALEIYERPLLDLVYDARSVHRAFHDPRRIQRAALLSIKTGGCSEDCTYCSQSARYETEVAPVELLGVAEAVATARQAKEAGASRFCMGAAWRSPKPGATFERAVQMVREVSALGMETCMSLGMLTDEQARQLSEAGLTSYNHNIDTSADHYPRIVSTRTFEDRRQTMRVAQRAGLRVCSGGIVGLGETRRDRCAMLTTLAAFDPHPESVPVNMLVPMPGTPLADEPPVDPFEVVRTIATARILMPASRVRLAAGRRALSREAQALCFLAGANSIFFGDKLLTAPNRGVDEDEALLRDLGLLPA